MSKRRMIPFEEWSSGRDGSILFCVQHFRLALWRARAGKAAGVPVYKTEHWAEAHADRYGHEMRGVHEAEPLARRLERRRMA